jgi:hypothetical protein
LRGIKLSGEGFGDFKKNSIVNLIASFTIFLYCGLKLWPQVGMKNFLLTFKYSFKTGQVFGYDLTRVILTINFLFENLGNLNGKRIVIIGDGYGRLGSLLRCIYPNCRIVYINLGRTLLFDYFYSKKAHPKAEHTLILNSNDFLSDFSYIEAEVYQDIKIIGDIFVNIASMQEMNMKQIDEYFDLILSQKAGVHFYCCNRVSKELPDGSIINYFQYKWSTLEILVDDICPWHQKFPTIKPPFIKKFDGLTRHRLVRVI